MTLGEINQIAVPSCWSAMIISAEATVEAALLVTLTGMESLNSPRLTTPPRMIDPIYGAAKFSAKPCLRTDSKYWHL